MIQPATIREIHRICREWEGRPQFVTQRPKPLQRIPTWLALLAASLGLVAMNFGPKVPLSGWSFVIFLYGIFGLEIVFLVYLVISTMFDAIDFWKSLRSSSEAFPPDEDRDLEKHLEFLRQLAAYSNEELVFVARSLEIKSRRMENRRATFFGIGSLVAAVVAFLLTHASTLDPIIPGYSWIPKVWPFIRIGLLFLAVVTVVGGVLGLGSVWLESSASANRALTLRRVVDDRDALVEGP